jgi:hypothetical protein
MSAPKSKSSYTSKGERRAIAKGVCKAVKRDRSVIDKMVIKQKAWLKGQNPWITVRNENTAQTNKQFVRVRAESVWGDPRKFVNILGNAGVSQ